MQKRVKKYQRNIPFKSMSWLICFKLIKVFLNSMDLFLKEFWNASGSKITFFLLSLLFRVMPAIFNAVIWDVKNILVDNIISIGIQPKVKCKKLITPCISFGYHFITLVCQILNCTLVQTWPPVKMLPVELDLSRESIV